MENIRKKYELFERLLSVEEVYKDGTLGFTGLCRAIGADPVALERMIISETGYSGEDIMRRLREDWKAEIKHEYGLKHEL